MLDAVKPELCEYGGNSVYDGRADRVLGSHEGIPILSTHHRPIRLFAIDSGTSCAAAKVAHIAARVLRFYPDASANLVRALLASSARVPQGTLDLLNTSKHHCARWGYDNDDVLKLCGYGKPDFERAVHSTDNRVTLYHEDELPLDKFHICEVPIPELFRRTKGERHISVALAFDPPTRSARIDCLGVNMRFDLVRGKTIEEVVSVYQAFENKDEEVELSPPSARCSTYPSIRRRQNTTLQKALHVISRRPDPRWGDTYWLVVRCLSTKWTDPDTVPPQRYAIVVTLEHREETWINLYQAVQERVREAARARVRVR